MKKLLSLFLVCLFVFFPIEDTLAANVNKESSLEKTKNSPEDNRQSIAREYREKTNSLLFSTQTSKSTWNSAETSHKLLTTHVHALGNGKYRVNVVMEWKIVPKKRLHDVISFALPELGGDYYIEANSLIGKQLVVAENIETGETQTMDYEYTNTPAEEADSFYVSPAERVVLSQNLKNDWDEYKVRSIYQTLSGVIQETEELNTYALHVNGGYSHQIHHDENWSVRLFPYEFSIDINQLVNGDPYQTPDSFDRYLQAETQLIMK
ncbi:hypothetical protein IQ283_13605 [Alkalihalobacillus hwajinpoensis]|uniref:hypothetical protein n=1 Tax=Guptibacillus hwajinpoensis TaxID=208199 RepID=UPI0018840B5A|nr:hypothetical protein [Pseudalkalibacillus hwajinpoensis]MBF0707628.1 hypothetical protein [Pseudalkalibacillus hwajinpoensis]